MQTVLVVLESWVWLASLGCHQDAGTVLYPPSVPLAHFHRVYTFLIFLSHPLIPPLSILFAPTEVRGAGFA